MSDLVTRLKVASETFDPWDRPTPYVDLMREAAVEIVELQADVELLRVAARRADNIEKHRDELHAENEKLQFLVKRLPDTVRQNAEFSWNQQLQTKGKSHE